MPHGHFCYVDVAAAAAEAADAVDSADAAVAADSADDAGVGAADGQCVQLAV